MLSIWIKPNLTKVWKRFMDKILMIRFLRLIQKVEISMLQLLQQENSNMLKVKGTCCQFWKDLSWLRTMMITMIQIRWMTPQRQMKSTIVQALVLKILSFQPSHNHRPNQPNNLGKHRKDLNQKSFKVTLWQKTSPGKGHRRIIFSKRDWTLVGKPMCQVSIKVWITKMVLVILLLEGWTWYLTCNLKNTKLRLKHPISEFQLPTTYLLPIQIAWLEFPNCRNNEITIRSMT